MILHAGLPNPLYHSLRLMNLGMDYDFAIQEEKISIDGMTWSFNIFKYPADILVPHIVAESRNGQLKQAQIITLQRLVQWALSIMGACTSYLTLTWSSP